MALEATSALTLKGAKLAVEAGVAEATKLGFKVSVAVVDAGGTLLALLRMDGSMPASAEIATGKAKTATMFARETKLLEGAVNGDKSNGTERTALLSSGYILMEGGVPIIVGGKIVGACGVSGVKPAEDAAVAKAAAESVSRQRASERPGVVREIFEGPSIWICRAPK
eukprot:CAMPEP_0180594678 /NCGR_PEP_ID=MMETSP1037_2-20121125/20899_1 /TAXON_ID=632150 /ORGANISM="Azadinium spinosum, Strain 3D9" /LENGTH=167 /DNA_ID=CAMNT_0022613115 /DNA_START=70 /DNA_END=570 /DNA_ORIENTATION=+